METVKKYLQLVTFSHTIFALPFAIIGFTLGWAKMQQYPATESKPIGIIFLLVLGCMVTARSAAMAFNRYLDRSFDANNPRTALREIPAGLIAPSSALRFVVINAAFFMLFAYLINSICFYLSPVALGVILFYSYTKRFTPLCHLVLGLGLSLAPIGAYLAVTGVFDLLPLLFSFAVIGWVGGFDIIYALQDEEFDRNHQLHSIPVWLGKDRALQFSRALHVVSACCIVFAGWYGAFNLLYLPAALIFVAMLIYQHTLVSATDLSRVNRAFMTANGIASVIFGILVVAAILSK
ncbi:MAG: 4-hydroxybenzoate octaprenyltransferase [Sediminibacterium sp.]|nr:4-hydroxybenzoate octaprenyltransferase [Sediminibacterium sp.]